ncbi:hypothetical protein WMY93_013622 [Mugilogobius chulae]|uniref:Neurotrypsin n=1 Tax=Mugilogobius chulae TaxID=88201 RepID=A0AAW0PCS4_9GOBI
MILPRPQSPVTETRQRPILTSRLRPDQIKTIFVPLSCSEGFTELGYYNGTVSQTDSGAPCLKWTEFPDYVMQYPGRGLGDHSFCRNPDRESNPWCFFRQNSGAIGWAYCDCHQGAVRLVGGSSHSGRVEVYLNGQWGAVCDSHWTHRDASVVCRQLGLSDIGTALQRSDPSSSESGSGLFHFERLGCRGDESGVSACRSRTFVTGDCSHGNEAGALCAPPEDDGPPLRLVGGEEDFEGRVEVFHGGKWGSICDDQWDDRDAEVVCRQLGFRPVGAPGRGQQSCGGRVEVYLHGDWGGICDSGWNDLNAAVVCRQLGHSGRAVAAGGFGQSKGPLHLDRVRCTGKEEFLGECPSLGQSAQGCKRRQDAGVRCDVQPQEAELSHGEETSCGLRKLEGNANTGEGNIIRNTWPWQCPCGLLLGPNLRLLPHQTDPHSSRLLVRVGATVQTLIPKQVVVHRKFKGHRGRHDLALIRLLSAKGSCMPLDPNTNAACLPSVESGDRNTLSSCVVTVTAAWNSPEPVFATWVPLMSSWQCKKQHGDSFYSHDSICAGSPPNTTRAHGEGCDSSSGGGLVCLNDSGRWVLSGVVVGGNGCREPSSPSIYTRVGRFRNWIDDVTGAKTQQDQDEANDFNVEDVNVDQDKTEEVKLKHHSHEKTHHKQHTNLKEEV